MNTGVGLSRHPDPAVAVGEAVGVVGDLVGPRPDVVLVGVTGTTATAFRDVVTAVQALLEPEVLMAAAGAGIIGGTEEVEEGPGLAVWALRGSRAAVPEAIRVEVVSASMAAAAPSLDSIDPEGLVLLLVGGGTAHNPAITEALRLCPAPVVGGVLSAPATGGGAPRRPGATGGPPSTVSLAIGGRGGVRFFEDGAVGVALPPDLARPLVSTSVRPIGSPWTVTGSSGRVVTGLGGRPAFERLSAILEALDAHDRMCARRGLLAGVAFAETAREPAPNDFVIRAVLGTQRQQGAIVVDGSVSEGATFQFFVPDPMAAHDDLERRLASVPSDGFAGAVAFVAADRGANFFGEPSNDAHTIAEAAPGSGRGLIGWFCSSQFVGANAGSLGREQPAHLRQEYPANLRQEHGVAVALFAD